MARPRKQTVDYFPHAALHKKTLFILEQKYGNDGYAFWFKLLEMLASTDGHYLDCNDSSTREFLQAITHLSEDICGEILNLLARLDAIDGELWQEHIIWSQNFVDGVASVYNNRRTDVPCKPDKYKQKPHSAEFLHVETQPSVDSYMQPTYKNPYSIGEETIVEETIEEPSRNFAFCETTKKIVKEVPNITEYFRIFWSAYPKKRGKGQAEKAFAKAFKEAAKRGLSPDEFFAQISTALERAKNSADWREKDGKYIPYPAKWLNGKMWEDEYSGTGQTSYACDTQQDKPPIDNRTDEEVEIDSRRFWAAKCDAKEWGHSHWGQAGILQADYLPDPEYLESRAPP